MPSRTRRSEINLKVLKVVARRINLKVLKVVTRRINKLLGLTRALGPWTNAGSRTLD